MTKEKSRAELQAELRVLRRYRVGDSVASVLRELVRWGAVSFCAYMGFRCVAVLAGKITMAEIGVRVLGSLRVSEAVAWIFGAGGVGYGLRQRRLRRQTIQRTTFRPPCLRPTPFDPERVHSVWPPSYVHPCGVARRRVQRWPTKGGWDT